MCWTIDICAVIRVALNHLHVVCTIARRLAWRLLCLCLWTFYGSDTTYSIYKNSKMTFQTLCQDDSMLIIYILKYIHIYVCTCICYYTLIDLQFVCLSPIFIGLSNKVVFWLNIYFFEKVKAFLDYIFTRAVGEGKNIIWKGEPLSPAH